MEGGSPFFMMPGLGRAEADYEKRERREKESRGRGPVCRTSAPWQGVARGAFGAYELPPPETNSVWSPSAGPELFTRHPPAPRLIIRSA